MLKLSKITLLLLAGLGISSLSGCGTIALLEQCASGTGTNAICPDEDGLVRASDGSLVDSNGRVVVLPDGTIVDGEGPEDVVVTAKDLPSSASVAAICKENPFATECAEHQTYVDRAQVITACINDPTSEGCTDSTLNACINDPYSESCTNPLANSEEGTVAVAIIPIDFEEIAKNADYKEIITAPRLKDGGFALYSMNDDSKTVDRGLAIAWNGDGLENTKLSYVRILPDTEVGYALRSYYDQAPNQYGGIALSAHEEIPLIAIWTGQVVVALPEISYSSYYVAQTNAGKETHDYYSDVQYVSRTSLPFNLTVDFKAQQISSETILIPITDGDDAYNRDARIWGDFGVAGGGESGNGGLAPGQLTGYFDFISDEEFQTPMTGIIGEDGAVGVFNGNYFGGFVAVPK